MTLASVPTAVADAQNAARANERPAHKAGRSARKSDAVHGNTPTVNLSSARAIVAKSRKNGTDTLRNGKRGRPAILAVPMRVNAAQIAYLLDAVDCKMQSGNEELTARIAAIPDGLDAQSVAILKAGYAAALGDTTGAALRALLTGANRALVAKVAEVTA